jgi:hypothetical protein
VQLAAGLWLVAAFGVNVPYEDEWAQLPGVVGRRPADLSWVWEQFGVYRLILFRPLYKLLFDATGGDFRAAMVANVLLGAASAAALLVVLGRSRGGWLSGLWPSDAAVPLLMMGWGSAETVLSGVYLCYFLTTLPATAALCLAATASGPPGPLRAGGWAVLLVVLVASGAPGILLAAPLAFAGLLGGALARGSAEPSARRWWWVAPAGAAAALVFALAYAHGLRGQGSAPPARLLPVTVQFLSMGWGLAAAGLWPWMGAVAVLTLASAAAVGVMRVRSGGPADSPADAPNAPDAPDAPDARWSAAALLAFLAGTVLLALSIGWARAALDPHFGLTLRYVVIAALMPVTAYLLFDQAGSPGVAAAGRWAVAGVALAMLPLNLSEGLRVARERSARLGAFLADLDAGVPAEALARRHWMKGVRAGSAETVREIVVALHTAGVGPYRGLNTAPGGRIIELPADGSPAPTDSRFRLRLTALSPGPDGALVSRAVPPESVAADADPPPPPTAEIVADGPGPVFVRGVVVALPPAATWPARLAWTGSDGRDYILELPRFADSAARAADGSVTATVWIYDTVSSLRVTADAPGGAVALKSPAVIVP